MRLQDGRLVRNTINSAIRHGCASLAIATALSAIPAAAQDNDGLFWAELLNQITVSATRTPVRIEDVPATISVKSDEQIADEMVSDIKDLVRFEPGVSVRQSPSRFGAALGVTGRDGASSFNIRGLDGNRVLIQVDGVRVPDGFEFGAQAAGRGAYVDLGLVKSVEILRGPASALYGSDGLAGAVSFTTTDPSDLLKDGNVAGRFRAGYDSADEEFSETAILAARGGAISGMIAYTRRDGHELDNQGTVDVPNSNRTTPNPQDTQSDAVLGKLVIDTGASSRLRLTGEYEKNVVDTNVLSGVAPVAGASTSVIGLKAHDTVERKRAAVDWRYEGEGGIDFIQLTAYWQQGNNRQFIAEDRNTAADRTRINTFDNRVIGGAADFRAKLETGAIKHEFAWGVDGSVTRQKGLRDGTVPTAPDVFPTRAFPITDYTLAGGYVTDRILIGGETLALYPALRFDYYKLSPQKDPLLPTFAAAKQDGSRLSPKIGAMVKLGGGFSLFANYAQGFKAPAPSQVNQFFENPTSPQGAYRTITNPNLKPETSETIEGGVRLSSDHVFLSVTGFSGRYKNFISQEQISGTGTVANPIIFQYVNLAKVKIKGLEGKLDLTAGNGLTGQLAISYAKGTTTRGTVQSPLSSIDPLKLIAGIGYREREGRFGGQLIMTHSAQKAARDAVANAYRPGAFTILDATAFVKPIENLTLRTGLFNITDAKYAWWSDVRGVSLVAATLPATGFVDPPVADAYTQPGRNVSVSLSYSF
ncbi:TonB-dependent hemoglobin/transferrin/lactoferrin family receptor [Novosphingobium sp. G106]|uniref:TonB-dependent hemoglobin/transferrin/lactoferrin family receptor n=1 Tax=Novosphingobium sp. G106 TaxID=2849500 RepID=UPI001C2CF7BC|nr:TonB-dependent hemoglobin/transferrin/lactoferrin family receptor [Novosphingobium sp. G106]MBV1689420.1 TonB-dependent hemoglobin/transferrin/lactoferrin family receptor [Novosphingobium sp. G106]